MEAGKALEIPDLLVAHLPRELVLSVADALEDGAGMAYPAVQKVDVRHRSSALGQMRHFFMNERFAEALAVADASPSDLRGNEVVVGTKGIFRLSRFNISKGPWYNARRSLSRRALAEANRAIEQIVRPSLPLWPPEPITAATAFFVGVFSGNLRVSPEKPLDVVLAVPDHSMRTWLFQESVSTFVSRYTIEPSSGIEASSPNASSSGQEDKAHPVLKKKQTKKEQGE
ncbi:hypothetical protein [Hyalangium gracile]|uniref:hypothetical protein n=1 Tax=Hyalangium gracile TaxID=394092 RepID=UPI001CCD4CA4|nr:hypothetical protein [Hyalangium gracile]